MNRRPDQTAVGPRTAAAEQAVPDGWQRCSLPGHVRVINLGKVGTRSERFDNKMTVTGELYRRSHREKEAYVVYVKLAA